MSGIAILTPCGTSIDNEHLECVQALENVDVIRTYGATCLDQARALLVSKALGTAADIFFWIDSDILFDPADVYKVADRCRTGAYEVLAVAYSKRGPGLGVAANFKPGAYKVRFYEPGVHEAHSVGLGFTAVRRSVFVGMSKGLPYVTVPGEKLKVWPFFLPIVTGGMYLAEDYAFSERALKAGFKLGIDVEPRITHKGSYKYAIEDIGFVCPKYKVLEVVPPEKLPEGVQ